MIEVKVILLMFLGFVVLCVLGRGLVELLFPKLPSSKSNPINAPSDTLNHQNRNNTNKKPYETGLSDSVNEPDNTLFSRPISGGTQIPEVLPDLLPECGDIAGARRQPRPSRFSATVTAGFYGGGG